MSSESFGDPRIDRVEEMLGSKFQDRSRAWEALQAAGSVVWEINGRRLTQGNKPLALFGDGVMTTIVRRIEYMQNRNKKQMHDAVEAATKNETLARIGHDLGIAACIVGNPSQGGLVSGKTIPDTIEALIGAIALEADSTTAQAVMGNLGII